MPAPGIYAETGLDPFADHTPVESLPDFSLLYVTLRQPAERGDRQRFYRNRRGTALRAGKARIEVGKANFTWEEARRVSLAKNRPDHYPLEVTDIQEFGVIDTSIFSPREEREEQTAGAVKFVAAVNERLAKTHVKDIYVYVHGYKVEFENPLLVASEMWHFLGYEGVMIAFSWPSTPSVWAYYADAETAAWSAQGFRWLLTMLAHRTSAERIHVLGYSAGTRLVTAALGQIALLSKDKTRAEVASEYRLGDVVLVGSDVDRGTMAVLIEDGLLKVQDRLTIYLSGSDKPLGFSRRLLGGRARMGETFGGTLSTEVRDFLWSTDALTIIDVTDAEESDAGNGHAYFRNSPWASSDVLITLSTDLNPAERGLVRDESSPIWRFPSDYVARLRATLERIVPGFEAQKDPAPPGGGVRSPTPGAP